MLLSWLQYQYLLALFDIFKLIIWQHLNIFKVQVHLIFYRTQHLFWLIQLHLKCSVLFIELRTWCDQFCLQREIIQAHLKQYFSNFIQGELYILPSNFCLVDLIFLVFNVMIQYFFTFLLVLFQKEFVFHNINHLQI